MTLAGGSLIFLAFVLVMFVGIALTAYSPRGSGISRRPYGNRYGGAPGAYRRSSISAREGSERISSRGTR